MYMQDKGNWLSVEKDGNPEDGLYVALYNGPDDNLIVEMLSYGDYEWYDENGDLHSGCGWTELGDGDEDMPEERDVVAYLPDNIDLRGLDAVRKRFKV